MQRSSESYEDRLLLYTRKIYGYYTIPELSKAVTVSCLIFAIREIMKKFRKENA